MNFNVFNMYFIIATTILNMSNLEGEEIFDPSHLGQADEVIQERVSDDELIFIKGYNLCTCDLSRTSAEPVECSKYWEN